VREAAERTLAPLARAVASVAPLEDATDEWYDVVDLAVRGFIEPAVLRRVRARVQQGLDKLAAYEVGEHLATGAHR